MTDVNNVDVTLPWETARVYDALIHACLRYLFFIIYYFTTSHFLYSLTMVLLYSCASFLLTMYYVYTVLCI